MVEFPPVETPAAREWRPSHRDRVTGIIGVSAVGLAGLVDGLAGERTFLLPSVMFATGIQLHYAATLPDEKPHQVVVDTLFGASAAGIVYASCYGLGSLLSCRGS